MHPHPRLSTFPLSASSRLLRVFSSTTPATPRIQRGHLLFSQTHILYLTNDHLAHPKQISDRVLILARRHPSSRRRSWHRGIIHEIIPCANCLPNPSPPNIPIPNPNHNNIIHPTNDISNLPNPFEPRNIPHYHYKILFERYEHNIVARLWRYPIRRRIRTVCHWKISRRVLPDVPESALRRPVLRRDASSEGLMWWWWWGVYSGTFWTTGVPNTGLSCPVGGLMAARGWSTVIWFVILVAPSTPQWCTPVNGADQACFDDLVSYSRKKKTKRETEISVSISCNYRGKGRDLEDHDENEVGTTRRESPNGKSIMGS
ncbi:hypothetical protein BS17DRAFT_768816 [Gyrodon lividus]|nr:hypothetical protein BS17DRAFT_768816 [Gyrodon lividus]